MLNKVLIYGFIHLLYNSDSVRLCKSQSCILGRVRMYLPILFTFSSPRTPFVMSFIIKTWSLRKSLQNVKGMKGGKR